MADFRADRYVFTDRYNEQTPGHWFSHRPRVTEDDEQRYPAWMERNNETGEIA